MNILVTGGAGFIGTNLIKKLLRDGVHPENENLQHQIVSLDNYSTGLVENHQKGAFYKSIDLTHRKYPSGKSIDYLEFFNGDSPDVIFHLAALARIQPSFEEPIETLNANVVGTMNILDFARKSGNIPVVYADSSSVHGNKYVNPYTFSKYNGAELCKLYSEVYKLPVSICRFYNVYGPHQLTDGEYCTVVGIFQEQYKNNKPLTVTWDGEQRRDFTHVEDIVDGLIKSAKRLTIRETYDETYPCEEYELGTGTNWSINELASWFGDYPTKSIPKRDGEMRESLCTDTHARDLLGWNPTRTLQKYIEDFVETEKFLNE